MNRIEKCKNKFPKLDVDKLSKIDPSGNFKYLEWICKNAKNNIIFLEELIKSFHLRQNSLKEKDINKYTFKKLIKEVWKFSEKEKKELIEASTFKFKIDDTIVNCPLSLPAAQFHSLGTKWCITNEENFRSYLESSLFYIIRLNEQKYCGVYEYIGDDYDDDYSCGGSNEFRLKVYNEKDNCISGNFGLTTEVYKIYFEINKNKNKNDLNEFFNSLFRGNTISNRNFYKLSLFQQICLLINEDSLLFNNNIFDKMKSNQLIKLIVMFSKFKQILPNEAVSNLKDLDIAIPPKILDLLPIESFKEKYNISTKAQYIGDRWLYKGDKYIITKKVFHSLTKPALILTDGSKFWYKNGILHRENGPAIEILNGTNEYWVNGSRHREDGPAVDGILKEWWVDGIFQRE